MHSGSGAQHKTMNTGRNVTLNQRFESRIVDFALGVERRGDGKVDTGKIECRPCGLHACNSEGGGIEKTQA